MADSQTLKVSCQCGSATHIFTVPASSLPLPTHLCSCNISRRISGALVTGYFPLPSQPALGALTRYSSSEILNRYFCSTCGTQMYLEYHADGHFEAAIGTLESNSLKGIIDVRAHIWIEDSLDGGASDFIREINGKSLRRFLQEPNQSEQVPLGWRLPDSQKKAAAKKRDLLGAHCHCGGVEFSITRPSAPSRTSTASAWPDLIRPFHDSSLGAANPTNIPWWLPTSQTYLAGTCTCTSCRRSSGFPITFWSFVPTCNIFQDEDCTVPFQRNPYWGTMTTYNSSEGVSRTFCSRCGCTVFWDGRADGTLVDVAVGILHDESGARAEDWLSWWTERVSFRELGFEREGGLVEGLEEGLGHWREQNEGKPFVAGSGFWEIA
jgi:hypothetical protein